MGSTRLLAAGTALVAALAGATPASAAPSPEAPLTGMDFAVSKDEATPGSKVVLSGWAGITGRNSGNAGRVDFFFSKGDRGPKVYLGSARASSSGTFRYTTRATATGQYIAEYRHLKRPISGSGTDFLAVYTTRPVERMLYSWTATRLSCLPSCTTTGPDQVINPGTVRVRLDRDCVQPKSGGRIGFTNDPANAFKAGDPGWREFPQGEGPTDFELTPTSTTGHFYLEWTSAPPPLNGSSGCDLSFTASQKSTHKNYL